MERSHVHDAAPGERFSTLGQASPVETKVQHSKVLLHSPQPGGSQVVYQADVSVSDWDNFQSSRDCAAVVLHTAQSGHLTSVAEPGITN